MLFIHRLTDQPPSCNMAGLRYEYSQRKLSFTNDSLQGNTLELSNLFPSASLLYSLKNKWKLKTAYSSRIQRRQL